MSLPLKRDPFIAEKTKQNSIKCYCFFLLSCYSRAAIQQYFGGKNINILFYFNYCWYSPSYLGQLSNSSNTFEGNKSQGTGQLIWTPGDECQQLHYRFRGTHPNYPSAPTEHQLNGALKQPCGTGCSVQDSNHSTATPTAPPPGISLKGYPIVKQYKFPKRYFYLLVLLVKNLFSKGNHCRLSWGKLPMLPRYFVCCLSHVL